MNKKALLEFIPLSIFAISVLSFSLKIPYLGSITAFSGMATAMLYFNGAFGLFADAELPKGIRIVMGFLYSISIIACLFCRLKWPLWDVYAIAGYVGLGAIVILCTLNLKKPGYKGHLYRCAILQVILSVAYFHRRNMA